MGSCVGDVSAIARNIGEKPGNETRLDWQVAIDLNFSDWLTGLFLRDSRQDPLSRATLAARRSIIFPDALLS
jgi:hypothetical protein